MLKRWSIACTMLLCWLVCDVKAQVPNVNGEVRSVVVHNNTLIFGGNFQSVEQFTGNAALVTTTAFFPRDFAVVNPVPIANGAVNAAVPDGVGGFFLGGNFSNVDGTVLNNLAHVDDNGNVTTSWLPNPNGPVNALALNGNTLYVGGNFTQLQPPGQTATALNNAAALDVQNLASVSIAGWNPNVNGLVNTLVLNAGAGVIYIGGAFTQVGNAAHPNIAQVNLTTGAIGANWRAPIPSAQVRAIAIDGNNLFIGGDFQQIGTNTRNFMAKLDNRGRLKGWSKNFGAAVYAVVIDGNNLFAGGAFLTVGAKTRHRLVKISKGSDATTKSWNPGANGLVRTLALNGATLLVGGDFTTLSGAARNRAGRVGTANSSSAADAWNPNLSAAAHCIVVDGTDVLLGGAFNSLAVAHTNIGAVNLTSGFLDPDWNHNVNSTIRSMVLGGNITDRKLVAGGNFTLVNGIIRQRLCRFDADDATLEGWNPRANGQVNVVALSSATGINASVYIGGDFSVITQGVTNFPRNRAASVDLSTGNVQSWNPDINNSVHAICRIGQFVYVGGAFSRVNVSSTNTARSLVAQFEATNGIVSAGWDARAQTGLNKAVLAIEPSPGGTVLLGGDFDGFFVGGTATSRRFIGQVTQATGALSNWTAGDDPNLLGASNVVRDIQSIGGNEVLIAGDFTLVGDDAAGRIARLDASVNGDNVLALTTNVNNGDVFSLAVNGNDLCFGGTFSSVNGETQDRLACDPAVLPKPAVFPSAMTGASERKMLFLSPAHPNPASAQTELSFMLAEDAEAEAALIDLRGALQFLVFRGRCRAGVPVPLHLSLNNLPAGVYLLRLSALGKQAASAIVVEP